MIAPTCFPVIEGSTDSEVMFLLALTYGLSATRSGAGADGGVVEATGAAKGIQHPLNMTVAATDGERIVAVRYSSEGESRSLFHSASFRHLRALYPDDRRITAAGDDAFPVLSEPLIDLPGAWEEVPEATAVAAHAGNAEQRPFRPHLPALPAP